jgi:putative chitinase
VSIKNLQQKCGIEADGVWGKNTLKAAAKFYKLTPERAAHFFGQCAHETGNFKIFAENLNYGADGLLNTFGKYFNKEQAIKYQRNPEKIANRVYANRMGNGDEASGHGWKYRGRGAIQLTGKDNYQAFSDAVNNAVIMDNPDLVASNYAFESAMFFFNRNKLWALCDHGVTDAVILAVTKKVNGGTHGLQDRTQKTKLYYSWLKEAAAPAPVIETKVENKGIMLSPNFSLKDLLWSETAIRLGIKNTPSVEHMENLKAVCENVLEKVMAHYGQKPTINSGYRGPALNKAVGGSSKSQHCNGQAVDFEIEGVPNPELAKWIRDNIDFDQVILEFYNAKQGPDSGWVHCSYNKNAKNRKQPLTARKINGKTVYLPGIEV